MTPERFTFHRTQLALNFIDSLRGLGLFDASSGIFLAAPRRTGKSTFLREDLVPEMHKQGIIAVYVDLWSDQSKDPALLIAEALRESILALENPARKFIKTLGLRQLNIANVLQFDLDRIGQPTGTTLADAFAYLSEKSGKMISLIIDEAQHSLNTKAGITAMFAIKAARDRLKNKLFLIFTGSHRDKLANLVIKKDQPFFGAQVTSFPLLNKEFTDAYTDWVNKRLLPQHHFSQEDMFQAFELVGHRPEMLKTLIQNIALDYEAEPDLGHFLRQEAQELRNQIWSDIESEYSSLKPIQKAVLEVLITRGGEFSPFTEDSMVAYRKILNRNDFGAPQIQAALDTLRERNLVWKSARGAYTLEDASLIQWFSQRKIDIKKY